MSRREIRNDCSKRSDVGALQWLSTVLVRAEHFLNNQSHIFYTANRDTLTSLMDVIYVFYALKCIINVKHQRTSNTEVILKYVTYKAMDIFSKTIHINVYIISQLSHML